MILETLRRPVRRAGIRPPKPTGVERTFGEDEIIVSKTDIKGRLTYVNDVFLRISDYAEAELLGQPHSMIRHPSMPRAVFKLLWESIQARQEIFAYVVNLAKDGSHYWVFAHVTPSIGIDDNIIGYHSNRRCPERRAVQQVEAIYQTIVEEEQRHHDRKAGLEHGYAALLSYVEKHGAPYDEFIHTL